MGFEVFRRGHRNSQLHIDAPILPRQQLVKQGYLLRRRRSGNKKAGEAGLSGFFSGVASAARLLPLQLEDFVLNAELLTLQIVDRLLIR